MNILNIDKQIEVKFRKKIHDSNGFTLLEILVVVGIIGIMFVVATQIFINTIRSANKANITNEARENGSLVSESLQRDVRKASSVSPIAAGVPSITFTYSDGSPNVVWNCPGGFITRKVGSGSVLTVTNRDATNGVNVITCSFTTLGTINTLVTLSFQMTQGSSAGGSQDLQVLVDQKVVAAARGY